MSLTIVLWMMYEVNVMSCSVFKNGLLSICEVMGLHMYIALLDLDYGYKYGP